MGTGGAVRFKSDNEYQPLLIMLCPGMSFLLVRKILLAIFTPENYLNYTIKNNEIISWTRNSA